MFRPVKSSDNTLLRNPPTLGNTTPAAGSSTILQPPRVYLPTPLRVGAQSHAAPSVLRKTVPIRTPTSFIPSHVRDASSMGNAPPPYRPVTSIVAQPKTGGHRPGLAPPPYRPFTSIVAQPKADGHQPGLAPPPCRPFSSIVAPPKAGTHQPGMAAAKPYVHTSGSILPVSPRIQTIPVPNRPILSSSMIQRMESRSTASPLRLTISGHGAINKDKLETKKRKKELDFIVPAKVTLWVYVPPGAKLEDEVGNEIEEGAPLDSSDLVLTQIDGDRKRDLGYPKTYPLKIEAGGKAINYTVTRPTNLAVTVDESVYTIPMSEKGKSLKEIIDELVKKYPGKDLLLHYACCGASSSDFNSDLFPYRGKQVGLAEGYIPISEREEIGAKVLSEMANKSVKN